MASELPIIGGVISIIILAIIILIVTRNRRTQELALDHIPDEKKEPDMALTKEKPKLAIELPAVTSSMFASVSKDDVQKAEEDLRILSVEKEIVSYALTRLFEAQAEGKITEKDKEKLLGKYKVEMTGLEKQMNDKQMVVRLHELESTQADLIKLFQDKFEEINRNIDTIRSSLGISQQPSKQLETPEPNKEEQTKEKSTDTLEDEKENTTEEINKKASPKPRVTQKSRAEEKVEAIQQEVLKILERLEKQDAEG